MALRKHPFLGKLWTFSGTTQWNNYLLFQEGGGGVILEMQSERLESSCFNVTKTSYI